MTAGKVKSGELVGGRYVVEEFLGAGGWGEVYRARELAKPGDADEPVRVALKLVHKHLANDPSVVERFRREARVAHSIKSPFVAAVRLAKVESEGRHWIAFELLHGEPLETCLRREATLPFVDVERLVEHVLEGLVAAHREQVVHRDLKPSNLFLEGSAGEPWTRARILDFGVSKVRAPFAPNTPLTGTDATLGSLSYMPPEQIRGSANVDGRADLYALGVVVCRCLTGAFPFRAATTGELVELKRRIDALTLFERTRTTWPAALESFQAHMLALDREERFASASAALQAWRSTCEEVRRDASFDPRARWRPAGAGADDDTRDTQVALTDAATTTS